MAGKKPRLAWRKEVQPWVVERFRYKAANGQTYRAIKLGTRLLVTSRDAEDGATKIYARPWFWGFWKRSDRRRGRSA